MALVYLIVRSLYAVSQAASTRVGTVLEHCSAIRLDEFCGGQDARSDPWTVTDYLRGCS